MEYDRKNGLILVLDFNSVGFVQYFKLIYDIFAILCQLHKSIDKYFSICTFEYFIINYDQQNPYCSYNNINLTHERNHNSNKPFTRTNKGHRIIEPIAFANTFASHRNHPRKFFPHTTQSNPTAPHSHKTEQQTKPHRQQQIDLP